jgi:hypothetical protein
VTKILEKNIKGASQRCQYTTTIKTNSVCSFLRFNVRRFLYGSTENKKTNLNIGHFAAEMLMQTRICCTDV